MDIKLDDSDLKDIFFNVSLPLIWVNEDNLDIPFEEKDVLARAKLAMVTLQSAGMYLYSDEEKIKSLKVLLDLIFKYIDFVRSINSEYLYTNYGIRRLKDVVNCLHDFSKLFTNSNFDEFLKKADNYISQKEKANGTN